MLQSGSSDTNGGASPGQRGRPSDGKAGEVGGHEAAAATARSDISQLIEQQIIPRLAAVHCADITPDASAGLAQGDALARAAGRFPSEAPDAAGLARLCISNDPGALDATIAQLMDAGLSPESLLVDHLAPAARVLGAMWEDDTADFVEVTMGLSRLQNAVLGIAAASPDARRAHGRTILFTVMPGDKHSLGSLILEDVFSRAGWSCSSCRACEREDILAEAAANWFEIIALTASVDSHIGELGRLIAALRKVSCNPGVKIMVGGHVFSANPSLADDVGADSTAADARQALIGAELLVGTLHHDFWPEGLWRHSGDAARIPHASITR